MTLGDLLALRGEEFIRAAYRCLLRREADPVGLATYIGYLRDGTYSKLDTLVILRYSSEGQRAGVQIPGLTQAYWARRIKNMPVIGRFAQIAYGVWSLPVLLKDAAARERFVDTQISDIRRERAELETRLDERMERVSRSADELVRSKADRDEIAVLREQIVELQHRLARLEFAQANRKDLAAIDKRVDALPSKANRAD